MRSRSKGIVVQGEGGVGDAFPIADDGDKMAVGGVNEGGGEDFSRANFFDGNRDTSAV
jgi:hypothetical protein